MRLSTAFGVVALAPGFLSGLLGTLTARPHAAARLLGPAERVARRPEDLGLDSVDVEYQPDCWAWWIPADDAVGAVVIVHGFEPSDNPRATDPGPRLDVAAFLTRHRYSSLVINLGYATGAHLHSGGQLEANDISHAVQWVAATSGLPVAVIGFSAGGHAAVAAVNNTGTDQARPFAVVTDSAFVDFDHVVRRQGATMLKVPAALFALTRFVMRAQTGEWPMDLTATRPATGVAMLHIHGDADTAISVDNLDRLAAITGGEHHVFPGADHVGSYTTDPGTYETAVVGFLERARSVDQS